MMTDNAADDKPQPKSLTTLPNIGVDAEPISTSHGLDKITQGKITLF